jgi:hypothetical protein
MVITGIFAYVACWATMAVTLPETPRIDSVVMSRPQPHESDPAVIWCDDFDGPGNHPPGRAERRDRSPSPRRKKATPGNDAGAGPAL